MATQDYYTWVAAGRPWTKAHPIMELEVWAHSNGVDVLGTLGNEDHLTEEPDPQDHTPFSHTAWPVPLPGYVVTAIDLANVRGLGQAIEDKARAGAYPWLKYMNHSGRHLDSRDLDGDGKTWESYPSSDLHVHLSIRSDWIARSIGILNPWGDDVELTDRIPETVGLDTTNFPQGMTVGQVLAQLLGTEAFGKRTLGPSQTSANGVPLLNRERQVFELNKRLDNMVPGTGGLSADQIRIIVRDEIRRAFADGSTPR
jgi:hypothetical protein